MPEAVVEAMFDAPPSAVLASLTGRLAAHGGRLTGVGGFGSVVTWQVFDVRVELVTLRAEITPDPDRPGLTRLRVTRVDVALDAALEAACTPGLAAEPGERRPRAVG